jgi:hypothetical protein
VLDSARWAVTSDTVTEDIPSIFVIFGKAFISEDICVSLSLLALLFFCVFLYVGGNYHLIVKKKIGKRMSKDRGWSDEKRRRERERDVWFLFWMLFNTRSSFSECVA